MKINRKKRAKIRPSALSEKTGMNPEAIARVRELLKKFGKRVKLAAAVDQNESRISEWLGGKRAPTPGDWIRLGKLALEYGLADPLFFWGQAGIDSQTLKSMAAKIATGQYELVGDTIPVDRFRLTERGREAAGAPVPLPAEFIPNRTATICLDVDQKSFGVIDSPGGLFILDTSVLGTANVLANQEKVVLVHMPESPGSGRPTGIYAGRIRLQQRQHGRRPDWGWFGVFLLPLNDHRPLSGFASHQTPLPDDELWGVGWIELGSFEEAELMRGIAWENEDERSRRFNEIWERVGADFPLTEGVRILGKVIGRLTGHLDTGK